MASMKLNKLKSPKGPAIMNMVADQMDKAQMSPRKQAQKEVKAEEDQANPAMAKASAIKGGKGKNAKF